MVSADELAVIFEIAVCLSTGQSRFPAAVPSQVVMNAVASGGDVVHGSLPSGIADAVGGASTEEMKAIVSAGLMVDAKTAGLLSKPGSYAPLKPIETQVYNMNIGKNEWLIDAEQQAIWNAWKEAKKLHMDEMVSAAKLHAFDEKLAGLHFDKMSVNDGVAAKLHNFDEKLANLHWEQMTVNDAANLKVDKIAANLQEAAAKAQWNEQVRKLAGELKFTAVVSAGVSMVINLRLLEQSLAAYLSAVSKDVTVAVVSQTASAGLRNMGAKTVAPYAWIAVAALIDTRALIRSGDWARFGLNVVNNGVTAAGGWAGATLGASIGMAAGPVGSFVGGLIGSLFGAGIAAVSAYSAGLGGPTAYEERQAEVLAAKEALSRLGLKLDEASLTGDTINVSVEQSFVDALQKGSLGYADLAPLVWKSGEMLKQSSGGSLLDNLLQIKYQLGC